MVYPILNRLPASPQQAAGYSIKINLAGIGRLYLLHEMFGRVTIPHGVWDEVVLRGDLPGASEVREARDIGWIST